MNGAVCLLHNDLIGSGTLNHTICLCDHTVTGVDRSLHLHTGTNRRSLCHKKRYCLTLHVGSHQGTVRIIVLQERDHGCCHREHHLRRYVHQIDILLRELRCLFTTTTGYTVTHKMTFCVKCLVRLCNSIFILLISREVNYLIGYARICRICLVHLTVRSLDKTIFINACIRCQRVDQTDVWSLRSLYRTHTSVMRIMDISYLESGTVTGKTTRS